MFGLIGHSTSFADAKRKASILGFDHIAEGDLDVWCMAPPQLVENVEVKSAVGVSIEGSYIDSCFVPEMLSRFKTARRKVLNAMKQALKNKDQAALGTMRLIMAALKDRDIAARGNGNPDGISDDDILGLLQTMIKQRNESAKMYRDGDRPALAEAEEAEIVIINGFLPSQLNDEEMHAAIAGAIAQADATSVKDMGQVMRILKSNYAGQMDFSAASQAVKAALMPENDGQR